MKTDMNIAIPARAKSRPESWVEVLEEERRTPPTMKRIRARMLGMWRAWRARIRNMDRGLLLMLTRLNNPNPTSNSGPMPTLPSTSDQTRFPRSLWLLFSLATPRPADAIRKPQNRQR